MSELGQSIRQIRERGEYSLRNREVVSTPLGIKTPLEKGSSRNGESIFKMHYNIIDQVIDNLKNLLMTQKGERIGFEDFGTRLKQIYSNTDLSEEEIVEKASSDISVAVKKYMPSINLKDFYSEKLSEETNVNAHNINGTNLMNAMSSEILFNDTSISEINKDNQSLDSIYKIIINFSIPALSNKENSLEIFVNSGK